MAMKNDTGSKTWSGVGASDGIGIGRAAVLPSGNIPVERRRAEPEEEKLRYQAAAALFEQELSEAADAMELRVGREEADILRAQLLMLRDPALEGPFLQKLEEEHVNAEYAFTQVCEELINLFSAMEDELLRARAADFRDVRERMLALLTGRSRVDIGSLPPDSVLVAEELVPSQTAAIVREHVQGIVTTRGTGFSHVAIIARSLGIPLVVGAQGVHSEIAAGQALIVDGGRGLVMAEPPAGEIRRYRGEQERQRQGARDLQEFRDRRGETADGVQVAVEANLGVSQELPALLESGAEGIGLFRTEFLYMDRQTLPSEEEQLAQYDAIAQAMGKRPVIIRTLDVGGDKAVPSLGLDQEENPYLGYRAIRFCLDRQEVFRVQLRALLRAAVRPNVRIMVPMVTSLEELRQVRELMREEQANLQQRGIPCGQRLPLGVMIETPAAALCARELAAEADFFSIGTNDLTQYALAVDRGNPLVAHLYDVLHPAVLRLILQTATAAAQAGIPVGICGEAAADPRLVPFFVGVGIGALSVSPAAVCRVKRQVCALCAGEWRERAREMAALPTPEAAAAYTREWVV